VSGRTATHCTGAASGNAATVDIQRQAAAASAEAPRPGEAADGPHRFGPNGSITYGRADFVRRAPAAHAPRGNSPRAVRS